VSEIRYARVVSLAMPGYLAFDGSGAAAIELVEAPKLPELSEVPFAPEC
jgi:hypothetical protein